MPSSQDRIWAGAELGQVPKRGASRCPIGREADRASSDKGAQITALLFAVGCRESPPGTRANSNFYRGSRWEQVVHAA